MHLAHSSISCGVSELHTISTDPMLSLKALGKKLFAEGWSPAFVIWSDTKTRGRGEKLFKLIQDNFPESNLQKTKDVLNANSSNMICLYNWQVPKDDFRAWWDENK